MDTPETTDMGFSSPFNSDFGRIGAQIQTQIGETMRNIFDEMQKSFNQVVNFFDDRYVEDIGCENEPWTPYRRTTKVSFLVMMAQLWLQGTNGLLCPLVIACELFTLIIPLIKNR